MSLLRRQSALVLAVGLAAGGCTTSSEEAGDRAADTMVERGARGAKPEAPSPPVASVEASTLGPPAIPEAHDEAVRATRGWLGRLELRVEALHHPFGEAVVDHPLLYLRRRARLAVGELQASDPAADWTLDYIAAWRSLRDYEKGIARVAHEEGLRPDRVTTQPSAQTPP